MHCSDELPEQAVDHVDESALPAVKQGIPYAKKTTFTSEIFYATEKDPIQNHGKSQYRENTCECMTEA